MAKENHVYITTTLPYVNADPHVGFAMEVIRADALARYYRLEGKEVFFNTGTDEHGAKIHEAATKEGIAPKEYTDRFALRFRELTSALGLATDVKGIEFNFIRTTDAHHIMAAQRFWKKCLENVDAEGRPDIYKKFYKIKYCVGCELEKTESELVDGKCPLHPNRELELREEENYFFRFSRYTKPLLDFYSANPHFVIPNFRFNETKAFVERGLEDFSISRLKEKMPWGVPVPGDEAHVMYVWFDALVNYISAIGWPDDPKRFEKWWPVIQYCGKDNNRQQSAMWQAMLMSAKLPNSEHIIIDGFITSGGQKMSKSLGNVISPFDVIEAFKDATPFPEDVLRFVLLHDMPSFEDGDLTMESIRASYTAHLQNGLGNLTSRIMKMATSYGVKLEDIGKFKVFSDYSSLHTRIAYHFDMHLVMYSFDSIVQAIDNLIQNREPFKKIKVNPQEAKEDVKKALQQLHDLSLYLQPFLPRTSNEIMRLIRENKMPERPLFNRLTLETRAVN